MRKFRYETVKEQIGKCITMVVIGAVILGFAAFLCYMDKGFVLGTVFLLICLVLWCVVCIAVTVSNVKHTRKCQQQAQENAGNSSPQRKSDYFDGSGQIRRIRPRRRVRSKEALKAGKNAALIALGISSVFMVPSIVSGSGMIPREFAIIWIGMLFFAFLLYQSKLKRYDRYELHDVDDYELYDDTESHPTNDEQQVHRTTCPYCGKEVLSTYLFCDGCEKELP